MVEETRQVRRARERQVKKLMRGYDDMAQNIRAADRRQHIKKQKRKLKEK